MRVSRGSFPVLFLACWGLVSSAFADQRLFDVSGPLSIQLDGPFGVLDQERDKSRRYGPGTLSYVDAQGHQVELPVEFQPRGNKRLNKRTCSFAPLRIRFRDNAAGSLFEHQKKLKLVAPCRPGRARYDRYVITEYLAYRALNLLTPMSYRVRLLEITATESGKTLWSGPAFVIEPSRLVASRIGYEQLDSGDISATILEGEHLNLISLFQMMIANTDWSATHGGNDECCHNGKLFGSGDRLDNLYIPYDFDMSGLVNPEYGSLDPALKLDSLRERRYRGYCRNLPFLSSNVTHFNEQREAIVALFASNTLLPSAQRRRQVAFIEQFYRLINSPKRVQRNIHDRCHKSIHVEAVS